MCARSLPQKRIPRLATRLARQQPSRLPSSQQLQLANSQVLLPACLPACRFMTCGVTYLKKSILSFVARFVCNSLPEDDGSIWPAVCSACSGAIERAQLQCTLVTWSELAWQWISRDSWFPNQHSTLMSEVGALFISNLFFFSFSFLQTSKLFGSKVVIFFTAS